MAESTNINDQIVKVVGRIAREMRNIVATVMTKVDTDEFNTALATKADAATTTAALDAKAETSVVNSALALKADKTEVQQIVDSLGEGDLATKTYVDNAVASAQVGAGSITTDKLADVIDLGTIE
jgi:hypothetical protein|nr:MAG TPA: hypothetical protein [Caudoviricetes sp.]